MNIYDYLDNLPSNTTKIDVSYKNLNIIPDLSKFVDLEILICNNNKLCNLPKINNCSICGVKITKLIK